MKQVDCRLLSPFSRRFFAAFFPLQVVFPTSLFSNNNVTPPWDNLLTCL